MTVPYPIVPESELESGLREIAERVTDLSTPTNADWIAAVGTLVAAGVALITIFQNRRAKQRSEAATISASAETTDAFNAKEEFESKLSSLRDQLRQVEGELQERRPRPSPNVHELGKGKYRLKNDGDAPAFNVTIEGAESVDDRDLSVPDFASNELNAGSWVDFRVDRTFASPPAINVLVSWLEGPDRLPRQRRFTLT